MEDEIRIVLVIQARMGSRRFPGKSLQEVNGKPLVAFLIDRLRDHLNWDIVVATSVKAQDDAIVDALDLTKCEVVRGDEEDVFSRFQIVAEETKATHLVRLTGDNPLVDIDIIKACVEAHLSGDFDLTSTREITPEHEVQRYVPKGHSVDVMTAETLLQISSESLSEYEKEHVIPVFFHDGYRVQVMKNLQTEIPGISVDTLEDLKQLKSWVTH